MPSSNPNDPREMAREFKEFLDHALPLDEGSHTLALGEMHNAAEHLHWLQSHLKELKGKYGITTIGIEHNRGSNPLFWAYQDGSLAKALGSSTIARNYAAAVLVSRANSHFQKNASARADLLLDALDSGLQVVAYDSRRFERGLPTLQDDIKTLDRAFSKGFGIPSASVRQHIRMNADLLEKMAYANPSARMLWYAGEASWLEGLSPAYTKRMDAIESLARVGHKKINVGKLTSDALSAILFDAMADPVGNRLTIGGAGHINGIGDTEFSDKARQIHGTFGHHLFAAGQSADKPRAHKVTHAMIATGAVAERFSKLIQQSFAKEPNYAAANMALAHLDLDTQSIKQIWAPAADHPKTVPIERKFPRPGEFTPGYSISSKKRAAHAAAHLNPLLLPEINAAADAVRAAMTPKQAQGHLR